MEQFLNIHMIALTSLQSYMPPLEQHLQQQLALEQLVQKGLRILLENLISSLFGRCNQFKFLDCTLARALSIFG